MSALFLMLLLPVVLHDISLVTEERRWGRNIQDLERGPPSQCFCLLRRCFCKTAVEQTRRERRGCPCGDPLCLSLASAPSGGYHPFGAVAAAVQRLLGWVGSGVENHGHRREPARPVKCCLTAGEVLAAIWGLAPRSRALLSQPSPSPSRQWPRQPDGLGVAHMFALSLRATGCGLQGDSK